MYGVTYLHHLRIVINVTNEPRTHGGYMYSLLAERVCSKYIFSARLTVTYVHVSYIRIHSDRLMRKKEKRIITKESIGFFFWPRPVNQVLH